jgi:cytochrome P450
LFKIAGIFPVLIMFLQVACAVGTFFYAATVNPQACIKAREEIDRVTGGDRLPAYDDRPSLPYVEAFYREVMRWRPAFPLGVAHTVTKDDAYEGYFIPKGRLVLLIFLQASNFSIKAQQL